MSVRVTEFNTRSSRPTRVGWYFAVTRKRDPVRLGRPSGSRTSVLRCRLFATSRRHRIAEGPVSPLFQFAPLVFWPSVQRCSSGRVRCFMSPPDPSCSNKFRRGHRGPPFSQEGFRVQPRRKSGHGAKSPEEGGRYGIDRDRINGAGGLTC
jgi:hypothetical protein